MVETTQRGTAISRDEYKARAPEVRAALLETQQALLRTEAFAVVIVLAGVDTAGRGETLNLLNAWMDPRWIVTRAWGPPSDEELERPSFWRYWRSLPPRGRIGLFYGAWYEPALADRVERETGQDVFERRLERIATLEKMLTDDGALILKFWLHLDAEAQHERMKRLRRDPLTRWRVTDQRWRRLRQHARITRAAERAMRLTTTDRAPWLNVDGSDQHYRNLTVAASVRTAIAAELERLGANDRQGANDARQPRKGRRPAVRAGAGAPPAPAGGAAEGNVLGDLDLTQAVERKRYRVELAKQQGRLHRAQRLAAQRGLSTIAVFEGWDAAGKGGVIRRITAALDARQYRVIPISAPSGDELAHHYLWRFMRHLSRAGRVTIFDRSWYGRVLVERVEGLASEAEYTRAYAEINYFEEQLVDHGILLVKFWLHISRDEQLRRFRERQRTPHKTWKMTREDWRNRRRWDDYERAVNEMVARTGARRAPWQLIEANDKLFARLKVIRTLAGRLERRLKQ